jgi:hypothetical protein
MAKVIAVTDPNGALLGVVRGDRIDIGNGKTLQAVLPPRASKNHHQILEVEDNLLRKPATEVHHEIRRRLKGKGMER